ncbi:MAG: hypothetical protein AB2L14_11860 [Candidatus Xenobiia bacterium LiM19]
MALIQNGSIAEFSAKSEAKPNLFTFSHLVEATRTIQPAEIKFTESTDERGIAISSIKLRKNFEDFLHNVFQQHNELYIVSWAWDFSGRAPFFYPGSDAKPDDCIIPIVVDKPRDFVGAGRILFPAQKITAGLAVRIMIWESDKQARNFGKAMVEVANTIKSSKLTNVLSLISMATGLTGVTLVTATAAANELANAIGMILQANSDDYVDCFEGYYPVNSPWEKKKETFKGYASEITLNYF